MELRKIEIDFDIHQMIELERLSFDEPPYLALRRLLKLPAPEMAIDTAQDEGIIEGAPFVEVGVHIPHGSLARMEYQRGKQIYEGQFLDGKLVIDGQPFNSLSAAANACAITRAGRKTHLNGWIYWKAKFPKESRWRSLKDLREKVRPKKF